MPARRIKRKGAPGKLKSFLVYVLPAALGLFAVSFVLFPRYLMPSYPQMMYSLLYFLAVTYFTGYSLTKGVFESEDRIELAAMRVGLGLSALPLLFALMETVHVPLKWYIPLGLALIRPAYDVLISVGKGGFKPPAISFDHDLYSAAAVLLSASAFAVALFGSFAYIYLEDGDPWEHASGVEYITVFGSYTKPSGMYVAHYLKPYPPSYDVLMSMVHQLNSSVSWTLKTFNALMVALSYLFAYFFVKRLTGDRRCALFSAFVLFMLPPYGSHTIWAHTLAVTVLFPVFWAVDRIREGREWAVLASVFLAGSLIAQPLMSFVIGVFFGLYMLSRLYVDKREFTALFAVGLAGLTLSMIYWLPVFTSPTEKGDFGDVSRDVLSGNFRIGLDEHGMPTAAQIFLPKASGDIFMQQGFGAFAVLLLLMCIDFVFRNNIVQFAKEQPGIVAMLLWLIITFTFLFSKGMDIALYPPRFWGIVAIPLAVLCGFILSHVGEISWLPGRVSKYAVPVAVFGLLVTSGAPKMLVQVNVWPTDLEYTIGKEYTAYVLLKDLPPHTPVYAFCTKDAYVIGFDKMSYPWDQDVVDSRKDPVKVDPRRLSSLLRGKGYTWALFDYACVKRCIDNGTMSKDQCKSAFANSLKSLEDSKLFTMTWRSNSTTVFHVN
jgi:hypothetical protein